MDHKNKWTRLQGDRALHGLTVLLLALIIVVPFALVVILHNTLGLDWISKDMYVDACRFRGGGQATGPFCHYVMEPFTVGGRMLLELVSIPISLVCQFLNGLTGRVPPMRCT